MTAEEAAKLSAESKPIYLARKHKEEMDKIDELIEAACLKGQESTCGELRLTCEDELRAKGYYVDITHTCHMYWWQIAWGKTAIDLTAKEKLNQLAKAEVKAQPVKEKNILLKRWLKL